MHYRHKINEHENKSILFQKSDSDAFKDSLWDRMQSSTTFGNNVFVDNVDFEDPDIADIENKKPEIQLEPIKKEILEPLPRQLSTNRVGNVTPPPEKCSPDGKKSGTRQRQN